MQDLQIAEIMLYGCNCWEVHILTALLINALQTGTEEMPSFLIKKKKKLPYQKWNGNKTPLEKYLKWDMILVLVLI